MKNRKLVTRGSQIWLKMSSYLLVVAAASGMARTTQAGILFEEEFNGPLTWTASDPSVYIKDNQFLVIGSDGDYDDWASKELSIPLSDTYAVVMEQRQKLESGGRNYRLPQNLFSFEDGVDYCVTDLPGLPGEDPPPFGWCFGTVDEEVAFAWTHSDEHAVPGEGYWTVTRILMTASGGQLYVKPDDEAHGWYSDEFYLIATLDWQHTTLEEIAFEQPWDSVCYVDYVRIYDEALPTPEPSTIALLLTAIPGIGFACYRRKRK